MERATVREYKRIPMCHDCALFWRGASRCHAFELLDERFNPSDAVANRLDEELCGLGGRYYVPRPPKASFLSRILAWAFGG